jgi:ubiquinone/menaquinone biosynthesis C-methylase UbiE
MTRHVDYDALAATFDRRYQDTDYSGVEAALNGFVAGHVTRALEVGCGTGHWLQFLAARGISVAGLDPSSRMLAGARRRVPVAAVVQGTAERLPWVSRSFARVFCINALHHFPDQPGFVREAMRVLRPGGQVMTIGLDPHAGVDQWYIYEYFDSVLDIDRRRYPSTARIREWMREAGFVDCDTREVQHWASQVEGRVALSQGRLDRKANSQLNILTEAEYQRGLARIHAAIEEADAQGASLILTAGLRLYATLGSSPG